MGFLAMTLALTVPYVLLYPFDGRLRQGLARLWCRGSCALCGLRLRIEGTPAARANTLFVANHVSYLDIPVIGALIDAVFVAKHDVAGWPVFGPLAKLARTIFIRRSHCKVGAQCGEIGKRLGAGDSIVFFPEGTSSDGTRVLPFKSGLFDAVVRNTPQDTPRGGGRDRLIQPISIAYSRAADGQPFLAGQESLYAWFGDMSMLPHLLTVFERDGAEVDVIFHEPFPASAFDCRKALAQACRAIVARGVARAHGRYLRPALGPGIASVISSEKSAA